MKERRDKRSMKEGAARAVLREAWLRGHRCVELQRDGKRTIFVCTRCSTRCYSDAALVDHLRGNLHARLSAALSSSGSDKNYASRENNNVQERPIVAREKERDVEPPGQEDGGAVLHRTGTQGGAQIMVAGPSRTSLEWIGGVELFFSVRAGGASPVVESSWFSWTGKDKEAEGSESGWPVQHGGSIFYAVVLFPYSDMIGRGGDWKSWTTAESKTGKGLGNQLGDGLLSSQSFANRQTLASSPDDAGARTAEVPATENVHNVVQSTVDKIIPQPEIIKKKHALGREREISGGVLRRACKRKKARVIERLCFICHQKMAAGKDVAALLNLHTKQMVCGSRNKRGVFHVYHCSCLLEWISMCELKTFTGQLDHRIDRTRKLTRTRRAIMEQALQQGIFGDGGALSNANCESNIFCPECQGTGLNLRGSQLERPRYRLAQVFDWILELIQARKAWTDNPRKQATSRCGLLFRDDVQAANPQSRGVIHCYSGCAELLTGNVLDR